MLKQLKLPLLSFAFLLLIVAGIIYLNENRVQSSGEQVLAATDEISGSENNCKPLPEIKNVRVNCPLCSDPQL